MGSEGHRVAMVVTQVSMGGFDEHVTVDELVEYLEENIGIVLRCRLKTSSTPHDTYPNYEVTEVADCRIKDDYKKVEPHAFVHFASPGSVDWAVEAAGRCELFLKNKPLKVSLGPQNPFHMNQRRRNISPYKFGDVQFEIGTLVSPDDFYVSWIGPASGVDFIIDPFDGTCKFCFQKDTFFSFKESKKLAMIKCDYKVEFLVREINEAKQFTDPSDMKFIVLLQLTSAPWVSYRTADDDIKESVSFDLFDDDDPWIRTTDLTPGGALGRCHAYRIVFSPRLGLKLRDAMKYLRERRVQLEELPTHRLRVRNEPRFGLQMSNPFFCIHDNHELSFEVMFLVNAVLHKGIFNQFRLSKDFFNLLTCQPEDLNIAALTHICSYKNPVFDAYKRLRLVQEWMLKNPKLYKRPKLSDDIVEIRRLVITPTKAYCLPPEVELSNRVLRKYKGVADRFLRVTFMDEGMQSMNSNVLSYFVAPIVKEISLFSAPQRTKVFQRIRDILQKGFHLCGRKYSFLAFSANQLRDQSAWFFAEYGDVTVLSIKTWMGKFIDKNVAKCAARMGQCFSSTYATIEVPLAEVNLNFPDIERNNYTFSDGVGVITPDLALEVAQRLKLEGSLPCAYQIRYAGCKGVVACWPSKGDGIRLSLRPSMYKFHSDHTTLEICSWTRFQPGYLNRQIITLLSTLEVPDEVFWNMQNHMISKLNQMLEDANVAFDVLTASCAEHGNTAALMLTAGFRPETEPHLRGMLTSIRAAQLWGLREKTRIFVSKGRWLMGCLDELGVLEQGQCFIQVSNPSLENCFLKHGSRFAEVKQSLEVIKGLVVIAKNPCLHPGDVRILEAVDAPALHHLYDCLVFPQKGNRPHTNEASGSDLDGDLYFVTWDENLIPPSKKSWPPMEYVAADAKNLKRSVTHQDIIDFFSRNMVNESLGAICNAHVVHADQSDYRALDEKCIHLAELAATAVDFPKTGKLVTMPSNLKPKLYPDFMGKEDYQSYKSNQILGRLYRQIKDAYDEEVSTSSVPADIPYDADLEVEGSYEFISDAWDHKCCYERQLNGLMAQYKVKREEEVVTGHVWSMPKFNSRKQGTLKERLKHSYSSLKKEFRQIFEKLELDLDNLDEDEKNGVYERKASAWYQVTYHPKWVKKSIEIQGRLDVASDAVKLSFAWIASDYLARIKVRHCGRRTDDASQISSLSRYLADRL